MKDFRSILLNPRWKCDGLTTYERLCCSLFGSVTSDLDQLETQCACAAMGIKNLVKRLSQYTVTRLLIKTNEFWTNNADVWFVNNRWFFLFFRNLPKMLDNEVNKNEVQVAVRPSLGSLGVGSEGISSLPMEGSSTMSAMPQCPKGGVVVKVIVKSWVHWQIFFT